MPSDLESFPTNTQLAARLACTPMNAGRLLDNGTLRAVRTDGVRKWFKKADLDAVRARAVDSVAAKLSILTPAERERLGAGSPRGAADEELAAQVRAGEETRRKDWAELRVKFDVFGQRLDALIRALEEMRKNSTS